MAAEVTKLYIIPFFAHEALGLKVADICWGSCGKGLVGGIHVGNDSGIPCNQPADQCPAFDKEMAEPCGTVDGRDGERPVYLRRLRSPWRTIRPPLREQLRALRSEIGGPRAWFYRLRNWWRPLCKDCGWPMKSHKPKAEPGGTVLMRRTWGYGIDHIRAVSISDGVLLEVASVHCTGAVESVLLTQSDAEALRDALDEFLGPEFPR